MRIGEDLLPRSLKVKNTFIHVKNNLVDDDSNDDDMNAVKLQNSLRQVSEPAPALTRLISQMSQIHHGRDVEDHDEDELSYGKEQELDDAIREHLDRQESSNSYFNGMTGEVSFGRQITEQHWPSWGLIDVPNPLMMPMMPSAAFASAHFLANQFYDDQVAAHRVAMLQAEGEGSTATGSASWNAALAASAAALGQEAFSRLATPNDGKGPGSDVGVPPAEWAATTTVMMRNLPNKYTQHMLLEELNEAGFLGTFDFFYLPIDPETVANRGYAFINFTSPTFAWMLRVAYEGRKMSRFNSDKVVSVAPAALQGFEANYAHYSTARVNRGDPSARPLFLRESTSLRSKQGANRRRGGRRSQGSLIDLAAKQRLGDQSKGEQAASPFESSVKASLGMQASTAIASSSHGSYIGLGGSERPKKKETKPPSPFGKGSAIPPVTRSSDGVMIPRFCPSCGGECQPQFRFCQFCGHSLRADGAN